VRSYDVTVTREAPYWVAVVGGVRGGATEARRLDRLETEVRDLLAGMLDVDEDSFELRWHYEPALGQAAKALHKLQKSRLQYETSRAAYDESQAAAVAELRAAGLSLRDAAHLLGISFQRVQQLTTAPTRKAS
jgi:hypothetical protein